MELSKTQRADLALAQAMAPQLESANGDTGPLYPFVVVFSGRGQREGIEVYAPDRKAACERHECLSPAGTQPVAYTPEEAKQLGVTVHHPEGTYSQGEARAAMGLALHPMATQAARDGYAAERARARQYEALELRQADMRGAF